MPPDNNATALNQLLSQRFSCRAFATEPVPQATLQRIVAMAQRTASWCNSQPWQVHITQGEATEQFRDVMQAPQQEGEPTPDFPWPSEYRGVYQSRRRECAQALYESLGIEHGDRAASGRQIMENFRFFGAPHVAMITTDQALGVYGAVDCGAYVANFLLAAASLGVATIPQAALAVRPQRVRDYFGLSSDRLVVCGISLGYAEPSHPANSFRTTRADIATAVQWKGMI
ncbi:nitroreductase [Pseudomonas sp. ATCC 13867]|uniref:nitroreductase n=1 Tax=Pseudomonas sp. ATCC 13867 TaxID=1294143 RepID=UPI0005A2E41D|nr:nitroreductase [Pseudomonas sp. ATCC 13867]RFQ18278.1 nitroreductase [Pseudomonas sp. ATCC 13867]